MMKQVVAATTAVLMCTAAGTWAFAQDTGDHDGRHHMRGAHQRMHQDEFGDPERMLEMMTRHLDLDDAQSKAIGNIIEAAKPDMDALRERTEASRKAMHDLDVNDPDYDNKLQNLSAEIGEQASAAALLHGRLHADVFAELTPEQRERAAQGRGGMRGRFHHGEIDGPESDSSTPE